jgi:hypothetical protein
MLYVEQLEFHFLILFYIYLFYSSADVRFFLFKI